MTARHSPRPSPGRTLLLALALLALLCAALESGARLLIEPGSRRLGIGSSNPYVDAKVGAVERLIDREGSLDCLLIGSSVVFYGLVPQVIEQAYRERTGQAIACYNLGIPALTATGAEALAEAVVARYQPRLLVYGFTLRALAQDVPQSKEVYQQIVGTPWIRYQRGEWTLEGWLIAQSDALRYYLPSRDWMRSDYRQREDPYRQAESGGGYAPFAGGGALNPETVHIPAYFSPYRPDPDALKAFAGLVALNSPTTQVLLIEMPLPRFFLEQMEGGIAGYLGEIESLAAWGKRYGVPLWSLSPLDLVPLEGWAEDAHHVNDLGAIQVSAWLGVALADAAMTGTLPLPH